MDHSRECPTVTLILLIYIGNTILLYVSLKGNNWVTYDGGYSGLWNHCNKTRNVHNSTTNSTEEESCDYISVTDPSVGLHFVRAFFIIGFIIWCLGMIFRYLSWEHRGTKTDKQVIVSAFLCGVFVFVAALIFTSFVQKEYSRNRRLYANTRYGVDHTLSFVGASLATFLGVLSVRHHNMLNSATFSSWAKHFPCFRPGSRFSSCCRRTETQPHATTQQSSRHLSRRPTGSEPSGSTNLDVSVISTDNSEYSSRHTSQRHSLPRLQHGLGLLGAVLSVRRAAEQSGRDRRQSDGESGTTDTGDEVSVRRSSGISEWSSRRSEAESNPRGRHMPPIDVMTLPPAYEDVICDDATRNNSINPPPAYDEVIGNRELILTPPPAYEEGSC